VCVWAGGGGSEVRVHVRNVHALKRVHTSEEARTTLWVDALNEFAHMRTQACAMVADITL
jgi:hypothetical protein